MIGVHREEKKEVGKGPMKFGTCVPKIAANLHDCTFVPLEQRTDR